MIEVSGRKGEESSGLVVVASFAVAGFLSRSKFFSTSSPFFRDGLSVFRS